MLSTIAAAATSSLIAIVAQDQATLRAAPRDSAQQQVVLWQGDALEIRGERMDYLQVYDHRRERAGYIKASQVRLVRTDADAAPESLSVIRFLREAPGSEALGISYAAAFLKAAPATQINAEVFDAIGSMADRLARRSTNLSLQTGTIKPNKQMELSVAAHLEVASYYGVQFKSFEREGRIQVCYDGEAFRRVLAMNANEEQKARAALALTRAECINPTTRPLEKFAIDNWRAEVLDRVDINKLSEQQKNRIKMRKASVWSAIAYQRARKNEDVQAAGNRAVLALAAVNKEELSDDDKLSYTEAGIRAGTSRWAAESSPNLNSKSKLKIVTTEGELGETCVHLIDDKHDIKNALVKRCTYSVVWGNSVRINAQSNAITMAVQPMESWRELWLFRQSNNGWSIDVIPPANVDPQLGYIEFAGWIPASNKFLVAREAKVDGQYKRRFEVINMDSLQAENGADQPSSLSVFYKWQDPIWKSQTLSLR
ncbi:hypothetical protein RF679_07940 [Undibacterium cyanobacteriorum]|uniref:SH3b domain-containing protein n=1 Tax=Undibacterium cyanobacteriorum TaxID=3073561 RepID=A0ABY9RLW1_9BURK|nr:hypothetical protein [Undibacterium sp. 20NA77.5]WMW82202.1 hypothetical protein RF679_07940 [Undibacterium sp. 20NA77.5]